MSWLSDRIEQMKTVAAEHQQRRERAAALKRDRMRNVAFWGDIATHMGNTSGAQTYIPDDVIAPFQHFLSTLEVPLSENPDSALFGLPVLQMYFGYSGLTGINKEMQFVSKWDNEHKMLALVLNAGLPVVPQMSQLFVECCEHNTEFLNLNFNKASSKASPSIKIPKERIGHGYPAATDLRQVRFRKHFLRNDSIVRKKGQYSEKFAAGAKLLEVFGANWSQVSADGSILGARLYAQFNDPDNDFKKYAMFHKDVDVDEIIAQKKRDKIVEFSTKPKIKI